MSDNKITAEQIVSILRMLAKKIEENPEILRDIRFNQKEVPILSQKEEEEKKAVDFNIFQIFSEGGEQALRDRLNPLNLRTLRGILRKHSLDPSKLAEKWKNKNRLVELIIERVAARSERGKVFKQYP